MCISSLFPPFPFSLVVLLVYQSGLADSVTREQLTEHSPPFSLPPLNAQGGKDIVKAVLAGKATYMYTRTVAELSLMSLGYMSIGRHYISECTILKHWGKGDEGGWKVGKGRMLCGIALCGFDNCRWSCYKFADISLSLSSIPITGESLLLSDCYGRFIRS